MRVWIENGKHLIIEGEENFNKAGFVDTQNRAIPDRWVELVPKAELPAFQKRYEALMVTVQTFLHDLDAHEARVNPSEIRMNSAMWMQVQAFRNLLEGKWNSEQS